MLNLSVLKLIKHLTTRGKGGGISRRRQSLKGGGDCRNWLLILKLPMGGDRRNITEP